MSYATSADGTRVAYQLSGSGPGLLLLSGQANNHHWWDGVRDDFADIRQTITMDYRGTGDSDKPDGPYRITDFVADAIAALDAAGMERVDVYGTSMGGRVAQRLAITHPQRVRRLVLGCTSPGRPHSVERAREVGVALASTDRRAAREALRALMYTPHWLEAHPDGVEQTLGDPHMPPHARRGHLLASKGHDAWAELPDITAPTLVLHGEDDTLNPVDNAALLGERIPDARVELLPGARHAYFHEFREVAGRLVRDFLTRA